MLWDVFCRVIDNFGDIGVCWRLAADLGQRGQQVRLWVDDAEALGWMAPQVQWAVDPACGLLAGVGQPGVQVMRWEDAQRDVADLPGLPGLPALPALRPGDVVIEAFGCDPPDAFVARMAQQSAEGGASAKVIQWINLEYLSAEDYVERSHGLRSPVWSGPGAGLSKRFFYPGFTRATGGLLREPDLIRQRRSELDSLAARRAFLQALGVPEVALTSPASLRPADLQVSGRPVVLVFCYDTAPLTDLLNRLDAEAYPALVLLTPGPAARLGQAWLTGRAAAPRLALHTLPALPQADFDRLLWCTDLNFVRGEDSAVRALWAGKPHIWQIYEQDDGVHAAKLDAFMHRWMANWPADLREDVVAWWRAWNRLGPMPQTLPGWRDSQAAWPLASQRARAVLLAQNDLCSQLLDFVTSSG